MRRQGCLFVIEGMDGSGKQTQTSRLMERLEKERYPHVENVAFPNYEDQSSILVQRYLQGEYEKSSQYVSNAQYVKQMSSFYAVDRVSTFMAPNEGGYSRLQLMKEFYVSYVCDRYTTSNILHQCANLENLEDIVPYIDWIQDLEYNHFGLPKPTAVFYLDVHPEISIENIRKRYEGKPKEDLHENIEHFKKIYALKDYIIRYCGWEKIECCEDGKLLPVDTINDILFKRVTSMIPVR